MVRKELSFHTVFFQRRKNYCYSPLLSLRSMPLFFQKQNDRSNFVWQNYFVGACLTLQAENIRYINPMFRIAAYYPFYNTFNGMQQFPKQTILYAFDVFTGPAFKTNIKDIRFTLTPEIHYMYQLSDEYHLNYLGGGISAGIEHPVARHWSILNNGKITFDYANSGTNKDIQNFDISYQYQASIGVRYSKKGYSRRACIHKIRKKLPASSQIEESETTIQETNQISDFTDQHQ